MYIIKDFEIDQNLHAIFLRETVFDAFAMLPYATADIARDTDIERAIARACKNVDPIGFGSPVRLINWMARFCGP